MKNTEFEAIKEEVLKAVQRETAEDAKLTQDEADARKRQEEAQRAMNKALEVGDRDAYKAAGFDAESARLDLEFFKQMRANRNKPAASQDDDRRIRAALAAETRKVRSDFLDNITELFTEAIDLCDSTHGLLNEINGIASSWISTVMKSTETVLPANDATFAVATFANAVNAQLTRLKNMKEV